MTVYVNRILNMKKIKFIGIDMDHTLIRYQTKNFESLVYEYIIEDLVHNKKYPEILRSLKFNFDNAIRGLIIDSKHGNILKVSRYGLIKQSHHGTKPINYKEQKQFYRSTYIDLSDHNYMVIDTSFSIAFCVLYGQLVDIKDEFPKTLPSYNEIALDVLHSVDKAHAEGSLKYAISQKLDQFVIKDEKVVRDIQKYIAHGKKFFILTNSDFKYANLLLSYAINPFLSEGQNWYDLFEFVITLANKPRFFFDNFRFLKVDPLTVTMTNHLKPLEPGIYQGGSATRFTKDLGLREDEILYVGDHIYGDVVRIKKDCNWRTALVIEELGAEIKAQKLAHNVENKISKVMEHKIQLENEYIHLQSKAIEEQSSKYHNKLHKLQEKIITIDKKLGNLIAEQNNFFNIYWERIFRAGVEETFFASQVERFACVYMEKLSDLLDYSPLTYFRAKKRLLAHDAID